MDISLILDQCKISRADVNVLVVCDTDETFIQLVRKQRKLIETLTIEQEAWERIVLVSEQGEKRTTFYPPKPDITPFGFNSMVHSNIMTMPEAEVVSEIMKYPNPSSLVRMADDKGVFTNSHVRKSSGINPNEWIGAKMSSYWIPEELERYKHLLLKHREINNFTYAAFFFTGETANFTVDARLVSFNGDLCRWVRVVQCDVIS